MLIYKKVEYHSVSTHDLYKSFVFTDSTYSDDGITINDCIAPQSSNTSEKEKISSYNHYFLKHNFYSIYNNSSFSDRTNYSKQNNFVLKENARFLSIPLRSFGKRIYQGSLSITDNSTGSLTLTDDGNGNLINSSISTASLVSDSNLKTWFSFDDAYIYKEYPSKTSLILRDNSTNLNTIVINNGVFTSGLSGSGYQYNMHGNSYAYVDNSQIFDFDKRDFSISFWLKAPSSQSINTNTTNTILSKRIANDGAYPFEISMYNTSSANVGKLLVTRVGYKDRQQLQAISFTSSTALNTSIYNHVALIKSSGSLKLYINGALNASATDYTGYYRTENSAKLFVGATGIGPTSIDSSTYFSGSIDELRVYDAEIDVSKLYATPFNTNIMGSIFYEKGIIVLNNLSGSYANILKGTSANGFTLNYRSVSELTEHEIVVKKGVGEFNMTMNPSLRKQDSLTMINDVSSSINTGVFNPYITAIGLYDDKNRLLAIGKIREPIKSIPDIDLSFTIRFDM